MPCVFINCCIVFFIETGSNALWEYSVVCPLDVDRDGSYPSNCDVVILPVDQPANVTISTAVSSEVILVTQETR